jgi:hypothetical protein
MFTQDFFTSRRNRNDGTTYIGQQDRLWYDPNTNTIRIGNGTPGGIIVSGGSTSSPLTAKGDLYTFDTSDARLPVGPDGYLLIADSSEPTGLAWKSSVDAGLGLNIDGGTATTVYLINQNIAGGGANSVYLPSQIIDSNGA